MSRRQIDKTYEIALAPTELWQQVSGVIHPQGNPSVGEFTRSQSRMVGHLSLKAFCYIN